VRQHRGLIVLVLVTAAALAAGLALVSRGDSVASGKAPPDSAAAPATAADDGSPAETGTRAPASVAETTDDRGLTYSPRARKISVPISAESYIAIDADTGEVLVAHRDRQRRPIASLTKMMTGLLVIERGKLGRTVTVPYAATQVEPNKEGLVAGGEYTRRLLLYSALMVSSNDSATALGYDAGNGSLPRFYRMMNRRARLLGMTDTTYKSASGLNDTTNLSSARDQAILAREAMKEPLFAKIVGTRQKTVRWPAPTYEKDWVNHNEMLGWGNGTIGIKTGYTQRAGNCLAVAVRRNGHEVIAVVLGSRSVYYDMPRLVDRAFAILRARDAQPADAEPAAAS
jgi:D-alanyl-D-alanine carboxypeptidase